MKWFVMILGIGFIFIGSNCNAQKLKQNNTQFMVRGYGHAGINYLKMDKGRDMSFVGSAFAPIFLFKQGDHFIFETELEFELEDNQLEIGLEYANLGYAINDYLMIRAGKFLIPFGTFMERLHPAWINRLSTKPLGFGHDGIAPDAGVGIELRGNIPIGNTNVNYSLYSTNGPRLKDGNEEPEEAGMLNFENYIDNNDSKALGGRIGYLPLSNSSLEIGISYYFGKVGDKNSAYEDVNASLWAYDFSYVKQISPIKGILDIKAQYNQTSVSDAEYQIGEEERDTIDLFSFNNLSYAYYTQLSYRPSMLNNSFIKNLEIVGRYSQLNTPEDSGWEANISEITFGLNYWITWRQLVKINYSFIGGEGGQHTEEDVGIQKSNALFVHWAIGF